MDDISKQIELNYITLNGYIMMDDIDSLSCFLSKDNYPNGMDLFRTSITEESYKCAYYILNLYDLVITPQDVTKNSKCYYIVNNLLRKHKINKLLKNAQ